jgi:serine/threonine protein phosphatase PrpC
MCLFEWERQMLYSVNCGDTRVVLHGFDWTIGLSYDHKGNDPVEIDAAIERGDFFVPRDDYLIVSWLLAELSVSI